MKSPVLPVPYSASPVQKPIKSPMPKLFIPQPDIKMEQPVIVDLRPGTPPQMGFASPESGFKEPIRKTAPEFTEVILN